MTKPIDIELENACQKLAGAPAQKILKWACDTFAGTGPAVSSCASATDDVGITQAPNRIYRILRLVSQACVSVPALVLKVASSSI